MLDSQYQLHATDEAADHRSGGPPSRPEPCSGAPWTPRLWQAQALPAVLTMLDVGRRAVVSAVMGVGKSVLIAELVQQRIGSAAARPEAP